MASRPTPRELMTLGMFIFGMDSAAYQNLQRSREWRHATSERHGARDAAQFVGPGGETITLSGMIVPELGGRYAALEALAEMAATGDTWPLIDGRGRIFGNYRIVRLEEDQKHILAGGAARMVDFRIELHRGDDQTGEGIAQ
ncbi:Phage tail protein [Qipengyuania citrea LAMA 915]|uniref:Phage tail protein n=1 Tax=Qipengyuania citrea LAMA 915 TaxID=1306953 RepID=A0A0L1KFI1_9SPHN|nr:phage tail protein [Qipengyuania citrea]KNH02629.1 Phage tail protein [Qipengyuania citrea LAMA 915]